SPAKNSWPNTRPAASEYSWKSMNSSAVPSQPDIAARARSPVLRSAGRSGAVPDSGGGAEVDIVVPSSVSDGDRGEVRGNRVTREGPGRTGRTQHRGRSVLPGSELEEHLARCRRVLGGGE